jgi:hypothetical protein
MLVEKVLEGGYVEVSEGKRERERLPGNCMKVDGELGEGRLD